MKKILLLTLLIVGILFAESRTMRIGDSQYFSSGKSSELDVKVTLVGVQNGTAILKKEAVKPSVSQVDYYYLAPNMTSVAPIVLQPYPDVVTSDYIDVRGICEPDYPLYLYVAGDDKLFSSATYLKRHVFRHDGSNFSTRLSLAMGENTFFISYASDVSGNRAMVTIVRKEPLPDLLPVDLDPIGSPDLRNTNVLVKGAMKGTLVGVENIDNTPIGETRLRVLSEGDVLFPIKNTFTEEQARILQISLLNELQNNLISQNSLLVPTSEQKPSCEMSNVPVKFTPTSSVDGTFSSEKGVRFVWARIVDGYGREYSRAYIDLGEKVEGVYTLTYSSLDNMELAVYEKYGGMIQKEQLSVPKDELLYGKEYVVEVGVTDVAGNRSNTYTMNLHDAKNEKIIDISLMDGIPAVDVFNYPVLVKLNSQNFDFSKTLESGDDIAFLGLDGTKLTFEKERFSQSLEKAEFWVTIPQIKALSTSIKLKVQWENPLAPVPGSGVNVWDENFTGVYHFNERYRGSYIPEVPYSNYMVYSTGNFSYGERCVLNGEFKSQGGETLVVEPLPNPGNQDVHLSTDAVVDLIPGMYGDVVLDARSKMTLHTGTYHFKSLIVDNDAVINADIADGVVVIKVKNNVRVKDRGSLLIKNGSDASMIRLDVTGTSVFLDKDIVWNGILTAPNATVQMFERTIWNGAVYAQNVALGMDVTMNVVTGKAVYYYVNKDAETFPSSVITGYALYAKNNITIENSSQITGTVGSENNIVLGDNSVISGDLMAWKNLTLMNHSTLTGRVVIGGSIGGNSNANWSGISVPLVEKRELEIPQVSAQIGTEQLEIQSGKTRELAPGVYANLKLNDRSKLYLQDGTYYFSSLVVGNEAQIEFAEGSESVEIVLANGLSVADRAKINQYGKKLLIRIAGNENAVVGYDSKMIASIIVPNADFTLRDRAYLKGAVWAKNIKLGNNSVFVNDITTFPSSTIDPEEAPYRPDWIADATRYKNNGLPQMAVARTEYIAGYESFSENGGILFKEYPYVKNQKGTVSCWLYFDGVSGRFAAASESSNPIWELKRTLEGNIIVSVNNKNVLVPAPEEAWIHLAVTMDVNVVRVYLNGELVANADAQVGNADQKPWFGKNSDGYLSVDELRFSGVARNATWILLDYITQKQNYKDEGVSEYALVF
jgi:predicted acyltransferase (DUF342 family)